MNATEPDFHLFQRSPVRVIASGVVVFVVTASAGAGKTVALADWLATRSQQAAACLSCDAATATPLASWRL